MQASRQHSWCICSTPPWTNSSMLTSGLLCWKSLSSHKILHSCEILGLFWIFENQLIIRFEFFCCILAYLNFLFDFALSFLISLSFFVSIFSNFIWKKMNISDFFLLFTMFLYTSNDSSSIGVKLYNVRVNTITSKYEYMFCMYKKLVFDHVWPLRVPNPGRASSPNHAIWFIKMILP